MHAWFIVCVLCVNWEGFHVCIVIPFYSYMFMGKDEVALKIIGHYITL